MGAPACTSADCWPGTGDNGEGDEAISGAGPGARGRVDALLSVWLQRRLGSRTMRRMSGGRGQTGGQVAMGPEDFRMAWLRSSTR